MSSSPSTERRHYKRVAMSVPVRLHHGPSGREYPARSVDASDGGMLMHAPAVAPLALGQRVRVRTAFASGLDALGKFEPDLPQLAAGPVNATIVRVDRGEFLSTGQIVVGVKFDL